MTRVDHLAYNSDNIHLMAIRRETQEPVLWLTRHAGHYTLDDERTSIPVLGDEDADVLADHWLMSATGPSSEGPVWTCSRCQATVTGESLVPLGWMEVSVDGHDSGLGYERRWYCSICRPGIHAALMEVLT